MTPEKQIQNSIITYLKCLETKGLPIFVERRQAGGFSYKMGISDLYAIVDGRHIEIEVKTPTTNLRPMQLKWQEQCKNKNILFVCAKSVDDIKDFLKEHFNYLNIYF